MIENYRQNILSAHLSAKEPEKQNLPRDSFCKEVVAHALYEITFFGYFGVQLYAPKTIGKIHSLASSSP